MTNISHVSETLKKGSCVLQKKETNGRKEALDNENYSSDVCGKKISEADFLEKLKGNALYYSHYLQLSEQLKREFLNFCTGNAGLPIIYDPFFKYVFDPAVAPERLSAFLSCILEEKVVVKQVLPQEGGRLLEAGSLLVLDIIVELLDGTIANVEIQKIAYKFPGERIDCYQSDLLLRQYSRVRSEKGKEFSYKDLKKVYTIVICETNNQELAECGEKYIHHGRVQYDSGLSIRRLSGDVIIALDIFRKNTQTITTELEAWLYFLCADDPKRIWEIQEKFPFFKPLYHDIFKFRGKIGEVLNMFSEELRIMDKNTELLMIDEFREEAENLRGTVKQLEKTREQMMQEIDRAEQEKQQIEKERQQIEQEKHQAEQEKQHAIEVVVEAYQEMDISKEEILTRLAQKFLISAQEAESYLKKY